MIYNYFTGAALPVPTITFISPADATVVVGAYDNGYFPLTISKDCQFSVNIAGFSPVNIKVEANTPVDLTGIAKTTDLSPLATTAAVGVVATNVGNMNTALTGAINAQNAALTGAINNINEDITLAVNTTNGNTVAAVNGMKTAIEAGIVAETATITDALTTAKTQVLGSITTAITKINTVDTVVDGIDTIVDGIATSLQSVSSNAASAAGSSQTAATNTDTLITQLNAHDEVLKDGIGGMYGFFDVIETDIANVAVGVWSVGNRSLTSDFIGTGDNNYTYTVYSDEEQETPLSGCLIWILDATDGSQVAIKLSNTLGEVHFKLYAGDYKLFRQHSNYIFADPVTFTIG